MIVERDGFRILLVYPNLPLMLVPPLAMGLFTRIFKNEGYSVDLFDTTGYLSDEKTSPENRVKFLQARQFDYEDDLGVSIKEDLLGDFRQKVLEFNPHCMVISVVEDAFLKMIKMLNAISDIDIPCLVGGVFPTAAPERCISFDEINLIGIGEGETTITQFSEAVRNELPLNNLCSTWYKNTGGRILKNILNPLININDSKPDFSLFDESRFFRPMGGRIFKTIPIETYRGCPYKCTFCNSPMQVSLAKESGQGHYLRRKTISDLREEILEIINKHSPEFIYFVDDSFTARPKSELTDFCEMYREFNLPFWFNTRPESCTLDILEKLKKSGCYRISYGIECGNEEFRRKVLKRYVSNEKIIHHFGIIAESGIAFSINLIIGFPGETRELVFDTIDLVRQLHGYDTITVSMFTPYHGTELRKVAENNQWMDPSSITLHTTSQSMLTMPKPYLSKDDLDGLMRVLTMYCYFPNSEWERIKRAEINDEEGNRILKHYSEVYSEEFLGDNQDDLKKDMILQGGTGCKSNPKDSYRFNTSRMSPHEIQILTT